jgi:hypothetical protein
MMLDLTRDMTIADRGGHAAIPSMGPAGYITLFNFGAGRTPHEISAIAGTIAQTPISFNRTNGWITSTTWAGYRVVNVHTLEAQREAEAQRKEDEAAMAAGELWGIFA